jgi:hypothetical protein
VPLVFRQLVEKGRRGRAALLLVLLFAPVVALAAIPHAAPEISLPACCRAHGKHHCLMHASAPDTGGAPAVSSLSEECPFPALGPAPHFSIDYGSAASILVRFDLAAELRMELGRHIAIPDKSSPAHPKRGPPWIRQFLP